MHFLEYYYETIIKHDLMNKFLYKSTKDIPELKKIILYFECKNFKIKDFVATLLALEILSTRSAIIANAKTTNLFIKIQKGQPIGCKVVLTKTAMYSFLMMFCIEIIPKIKNFLQFKRIKHDINSFSFKLHNNDIVFSNLQEHFDLLTKISDLQITLVTNTKTQNELFFLLKSLKLPLKLK